MKTDNATNQRIGTLLAEARTALDAVLKQQRDTGEFKEEDRMMLITMLGQVTGFFDALRTVGYTQIPSDLTEQWATIQADTRDVRYVSWRPKP